MTRPPKKMLAICSLVIFFMLPGARLLAADEAAVPPPDETRLQARTEALKREFLKLKEDFEKDVKRVREQNVLTTMALETTAQSWGLAATFMKVDASRGMRQKKTAMDRAMTAKNWDRREMAALEYYYEAILLITRAMSMRNNQPPLLTELDAIAAKTAEQKKGLEAKPDGALEKRVLLSGALSGVMAVAVKSVGGGAMEKPVQLIVKEMLYKANSISERPDIHYRAKLSLLYANNVDGLTALIFLLGHNAGPPLSNELAKVHSSWKDHLEDANLPDALSLTWTAQYQAVLPLSFWLATH